MASLTIIGVTNGWVIETTNNPEQYVVATSPQALVELIRIWATKEAYIVGSTKSASRATVEPGRPLPDLSREPGHGI